MKNLFRLIFPRILLAACGAKMQAPRWWKLGRSHRQASSGECRHAAFAAGGSGPHGSLDDLPVLPKIATDYSFPTLCRQPGQTAAEG
jgi:hypothetical protein